MGDVPPPEDPRIAAVATLARALLNVTLIQVLGYMMAKHKLLPEAALPGAGAFIASFVFPCVVLIATRAASGRGLVLDKWNFGRDVGFYAVASAMERVETASEATATIVAVDPCLVFRSLTATSAPRPSGGCAATARSAAEAEGAAVKLCHTLLDQRAQGGTGAAEGGAVEGTRSKVKGR